MRAVASIRAQLWVWTLFFGSWEDAKIFKFLIQTERQSKAAECFAAAQKIFSKLHIFFDIALQGPKNKSKEQGARPEPGSGSGAVSSFRTKE
jgi:hypothetical protein